MNRFIKNILAFIVLGLFVFVTVSFSEKQHNKKSVVYISGSSTMHGLMTELSKTFCFKNRDFSIKIQGTGSGNGFKDLVAGKAQLAMMSRSLKHSEKESANQKLQLIELARDGVMPVVSNEVFTYLQALTLSQIADIYSGKIKNWKELNGPDREIFVIDKVKSSGTRSVYMKALFNNSKAEAKGADIVVGTTAEEANHIRKSKGAIGMLSNAWLDEEIKGLSIIMKRKLMRPLKANIDNGTYPIIRPLNLVTSEKMNGPTKKFIDYIMSNKGQKIIAESGYSVVQN